MKKYFIIVIVGCLSLFLFACSDSDTVKPSVGTSVDGLEVPIENAAISLVKDSKEGDYTLVDTEGLKKMISDDKEELLIIDTMPAENYEKNHIEGAFNAPMPKDIKDLKKEEKDVLLKIAEENKGKTIVIYCGFTSCRRSHVGAILLKEEGYKDVVRYPGGIVAWDESK